MEPGENQSLKGKAEREELNDGGGAAELQECLQIQGKHSMEKMVHVKERGRMRKQGRRAFDLANRMSLTAVETGLPLG